MLTRRRNRISLQHGFILLLLLSAFLQPTHTTNHSFSTFVKHATNPVLHINALPSSKALADLHDEHDKELCGQCQFGFMGDGVQSNYLLADGHSQIQFLGRSDFHFYPQQTIIRRNRGPPLS